ncbi:hypothetical protein OESDEN_19497 [Oesophagostomum dentatum]|uniref:Cns1/TTC4 wheel domain-containing protein n=1 Tax=Oesophagostomum dentatum TaxID=61180 RepID=A0A0B1S649_OESDE|nr:hypothetical protein OESDEN_19497 [Oesophagostomum dentatum]
MDWSLLEVNLAQTPEVGQVDVLTDCDETSQVGSVLRPMLENPAEWDKDHKFRIDNVRFFVSDQYNEYAMEVFEWSTFGSILSLPGFQIVQGLPVIMIYTRDEVDKKFSAIDDNKFIIN